MRDQLMAELRHRAETFNANQDPQAILDNRASELRDALRKLIFQPGAHPPVDIEVMLAVAQLSLARYAALPEGEDQQELDQALDLFAALLVVDPAIVPPPVRAAAEGRLNQGVNARPDAWGARAALIGETYRSSTDPKAAGLLGRVAAVLRTVVQIAGDTGPSPYPAFLAGMLESLYQLTGRVEPLTEAIGVLSSANARYPADADALTLLGALYRKRFERSGASEDIVAAVATQRMAVSSAAGTTELEKCKMNLSVALIARYGHLGDRADLDEAIQLLRSVVAATASGDARLAGRLSVLGSALDSRYEAYADRHDLDDAIASHRSAVELAPDTPQYLLNLSIALNLRYYAGRQDADLDEALEDIARAVEVTSPEHPRFVTRQLAMANLLFNRYERDQDPADLEKAHLLLETVGGRATGLDALDLRAQELAHKWDRGQKDETGLTQVIELLRDGIAAGSPSRVTLASAQSWLASLLRLRYEATAALDDLDEAIVHARHGMTSMPDVHLGQAGRRANLGRLLQIRYERLGVVRDIDEAIEVTRAAAARVTSGDVRADRLSDLGNALQMRFDRTGNLDDLTEAIAVNRKAVNQDGHRKPRLVSNLTVSLLARYEYLGELTDLDEAVELLRPLLDRPWKNNEHRIRAISNLGIMLHARFAGRGDRSDLDEAVVIARTAVREVGDLPDLSRCLTTLGSTLSTRFRLGHDLGDLEEALTVFRRALVEVPQDSPLWPKCCANMASILMDQAEQAHDEQFLAEALRLVDEALERPDLTGPSQYLALTFRARGLELQYQVSGELRYRHMALAALANAASIADAPARQRIQAAQDAGDLAAELGDLTAVMEHYAAAVALLPLVAWRGLLRSRQEGMLTSLFGLAGSAAAWAITAERPDRAVEVLEQGRAVLWSNLLELRSDLAELGQVAPELAERLQAISLQLELGADPSMPEAETGLRSDRRIGLAHSWDRAVAEVRALPGWSGFLLPASFDQLRMAVGEATVIMINFSVRRCDALAVDRDGVRVIPLPRLTAEAAIENVNNYLRVFAALDSDGPSGVVEWIDANQRLQMILEWLWDAAVEPVITELGLARAGEPAGPVRLQWCPTGPLALLPWHAAGRHDPDDEDRAALMDIAISSYTPTLHAVAYGHESRNGSQDGRMLIVAMSETPGMQRLPGAREEAELVAKRFPGRHTLLCDEAATVGRILAELAEYTWAHFACHGRQDIESPAESGIALYDGLLTLNDLVATRRGTIELAFLSACQTATGSAPLADEALHLAAALLQAGCRHVIGTLWSIADSPAAELSDSVYAYLAADGESLRVDYSAAALRQAVLQLRDRNPMQPLLWAPYIHAGP